MRRSVSKESHAGDSDSAESDTMERQSAAMALPRPVPWRGAAVIRNSVLGPQLSDASVLGSHLGIFPKRSRRLNLPADHGDRPMARLGPVRQVATWSQGGPARPPVPCHVGRVGGPVTRPTFQGWSQGGPARRPAFLPGRALREYLFQDVLLLLLRLLRLAVAPRLFLLNRHLAPARPAPPINNLHERLGRATRTSKATRTRSYSDEAYLNSPWP